MKTNLTLDRNIVAVTVDSLVHVLVELTAPTRDLQRPPLDIVAVVDCSSSMSGAPIDSVRAALHTLQRLLNVDDRLGIVDFADEAAVRCPLVGAGNQLERSIDDLHASGSTNLSAGLLAGLQLAGDGRSEARRSLIVLSDGHANRGVVDPAQLAQVCSTGAEHSVRVSTIGFADNFDEHLMGRLADHGRGDAHWCEGPETAEEIYRAEFDNLSSVVAQNLTVRATRSIDGVLVGLLNDYPIADEPDRVTVNMGDAYSGETRRLVMAFTIPKGLPDGHVQLAELELSWVDVGDEIVAHRVVQPVNVTTTDDPDSVPEADRTVHEEVLVLGAAKARDEAREFANRGEFKESRSRLELELGAIRSEASRTGSKRLVDETSALEIEIERSDKPFDAQFNKQVWMETRSKTRGRDSRDSFDPQTPRTHNNKRGQS